MEVTVSRKGVCSMASLPVSVLNLVPLREGQGPREAIQSAVELAQAVEKLGYVRCWIAEHHNTPTLVSTATVVLIQHVLERTSAIRVGSGGVMLPNHSPLIVAEQFGTLAVLYPGRVDLGLGRAPGTDMKTADAIRRNRHEAVYMFPDEVRDLLRYFGPPEVQSDVRAYPAVGTGVPLYILGSTTDSAELAAYFGLPYAFASHFAPEQTEAAIRLYRSRFRPSPYLEKPYMIVCLNVVAAETDEEARHELSTSIRFFLNIVRGQRQPLLPPEKAEKDLVLTLQERAALDARMSMMIIGGRDAVKKQLAEFLERHEADEIMAVTYIFDPAKQIRSYEIFREAAEAVRK